MRAIVLALLLASLSLAGCSDINNRDSDGDSMFDRTESRGWTVTVDYLSERVAYPVTSDPGSFDSDGDGIPDGDEFFQSLDPRSADTDQDGLTDCQELRHTNRTQCEASDFLGPFDGGYGTDPVRADSDPGVSPYVLDVQGFTDATNSGYQPDFGDGISDGDELAGYTISLPGGRTRLVQSDPRNADTDEDALDDGEEALQFHTDPTVADTDGDGCLDGVDPVPTVAEAYRPGLRSFLLKADADSPEGKADLVLFLLVGNQRFDVPPAGSVSAETGKSVDLATLEPDAVRPTDCTYRTRNPWLPIQAVAQDTDGLSAQALDIASITPGPGLFYWNPQTGKVSSSPTGESSHDGPLVFEGDSGRLELWPAWQPV